MLFTEGNSLILGFIMSFDNTFTKDEIYEIGKHLIETGEWRRYDNDDGQYALLCIRLPYEADLSSNGSRVDAVNEKLNCK